MTCRFVHGVDRFVGAFRGSVRSRGSGIAGVILALCAVAAIAGGAVGCKREQATAGGAGGGAGGAAKPPSVVSVVTVTSQSLPIEFAEIGQTAASRRVEVRSRIKGFISKRLFDEGQRVTEGQLLYTIDDREYRVALQTAEANLARATANLENAERDVGRLEPLVRQQSISQKELDDAQTRLKVGTGDVAAARAAVERARLDLTYTRISSPVTGIIGLTRKQEGSYVDEMNNSLLTETLQTDPMHVNFNIPERTMLRYRADVASGRVKIPADEKWKVVVQLLDGSIYEQTGKLTIVGFEVNAQTGTALFRAEMPNPQGRLIDGQFVRVKLLGATRPDVVSVPQRAVQLGDQGAFVYVLGEGNKATLRPVKAGEWSAPDWIIDEGLRPGDKVIVDGLQMIVPGAEVDPKPYTPATRPATTNPN